MVLAAWEDQGSGARDVFLRRSMDFGESWSAAVRLDDDGEREPSPSYHPQIALAEKGASVLWWDESHGLSDVLVRSSFDDGNHWNEMVRLDEGNPGEAASRDVSIDVRGEFVAVVWKDEGGAVGQEAMARIGVDSGRRWSAPIRFGRPRWAGSIEDPRVAMDDRGRAHVLWIAIPERESETAAPRLGTKSKIRPSDPALYHAAIDSGGIIFAPHAIPAAVPHAGLTWIGGAGSVLWMAWAGTRIDAGSIEAALSTNSGETWRTVGLPSVQNPGESFLPILSLTGNVDASGALHLAWIEGRRDQARLKYVRLEPAGSSRG
jgi:hypothetical protein